MLHVHYLSPKTKAMVNASNSDFAVTPTVIKPMLATTNRQNQLLISEMIQYPEFDNDLAQRTKKMS